MRVKVLTVKQPWASLIVHGIKDIENRSWQTNFRGRVLIHSSAKGDIAKFGCLQPSQRLKVLNTPMSRIGFNDLPFGSIIGSVEIVDCVQIIPQYGRIKVFLTGYSLIPFSLKSQLKM